MSQLISPTKPALQSKINSVAVALPVLIGLLITFLPDHAAEIGKYGAAIQGALTFVLRTWFTDTAIRGAL